MKHFTPIVLSLLCVFAISCKSGHRQAKTAAVDTLKVAQPYRLCSQSLTSDEGIYAAFAEDTSGTILAEMTPACEAFFFPEKDIRESELVKKVMIRYNSAAIYNQVHQGYDIFQRMSSDGEIATKEDTLALIADTQPGISHELVDKALPGTSPQFRNLSKTLLDAYKNSDGVWSESCPLAKAIQAYMDGVDEYPCICSDSMVEEFKKGFWEWYDKARFVSGIDDIIRMSIPETETELSEEQLKHFHDAIVSEKDIDRRAILALEYVKFNREEGSVLLGEILECGQYTRYLFEAWLSWRANLQLWQAPSSYSIIPNNYYDKLRAKCLNTLLRHYQETNEPSDLCFIENFIQAYTLQRMSYYGNESLAYVANLASKLFIHPRITGNDYLEEE